MDVANEIYRWDGSSLRTDLKVFVVGEVPVDEPYRRNDDECDSNEMGWYAERSPAHEAEKSEH